MFKVIKESFDITNNYLALATPLILFALISSLYLLFSTGGSSLGLIIPLILFFLMLGAFFSGWFYMVKKAVTNTNSEQKDQLMKEFPAGVGEYFLIVTGALINILLISSIIITVIMLVGKKFIGIPDITYSQLFTAAENFNSMKSFIDSLSTEQLIIINKWNFLIFFTVIFNYFIYMFYFPAIFFKKKNPFIAFWISLKDLFCRKIFCNICLFLGIFIIYTIISSLMAIFRANIFLHFILTLTNFYYLTFIAVLIFNYYYSNYAKIGSAIDKLI